MVWSITGDCTGTRRGSWYLSASLSGRVIGETQVVTESKISQNENTQTCLCLLTQRRRLSCNDKLNFGCRLTEHHIRSRASSAKICAWGRGDGIRSQWTSLRPRTSKLWTQPLHTHTSASLSNNKSNVQSGTGLCVWKLFSADVHGIPSDDEASQALASAFGAKVGTT